MHKIIQIIKECTFKLILQMDRLFQILFNHLYRKVFLLKSLLFTLYHLVKELHLLFHFKFKEKVNVKITKYCYLKTLKFFKNFH